MSKQSVMFGQWLPDQPPLNNPGLLTARNCIPGANGYEPFGSQSVIGQAALDGIVLGAASTSDADGFARTYAGTPTKLYRITQANADVSRPAGYTLGVTDYWRFSQYSDRVIAVSLGSETQSKLFGDATFTDLTDAPKAQVTANIANDFIFLGNIVAGSTAIPNRVQWSAFRDPTGWTPGTDLSDFRDLQAQKGPVTGIVGGDVPAVFQKGGLWRMVFVGTPDIWQFTEIEGGRGCVAPRSIVTTGRLHGYLGSDSFYIFDGTHSVDIGEDRIARTFMKSVDSASLPFVQGVLDPLEHRFIWLYKDRFNGVTDNRIGNMMIAYDIHRQQWTEIEHELDTIFDALTPGWTLEDLNVYGGLEDVPASLDSQTWVGGAEQLQGFNRVHEQVNFTGPVLQGIFETGEHVLTPGRTSTLQEVRPYGDGAINVSLGTRNTQQEALTTTVLRPLDDEGTADFDNDARYHRALITLDDWTVAQGLEVEYEQSGDRS